MSKQEQIKLALESMGIGMCGVKWDLVVWRVSSESWVVGETGVRKDGARHDIDSAVNWFAWKRGIAV